MVFWNDVVRSNENNEGVFYFSTSFLSIAYSIINNSPSPCILPKAQSFLQLSKEVKVGDWFLFEDYEEIRYYGDEGAPYRLPTFVPTRLFSLEFIRQSLNADQVHFFPIQKRGIYSNFQR